MSNGNDHGMHFDHEDVVRMIADLQYMRVMGVGGAKRHFAKLVRDEVAKDGGASAALLALGQARWKRFIAQ